MSFVVFGLVTNRFVCAALTVDLVELDFTIKWLIHSFTPDSIRMLISRRMIRKGRLEEKTNANHAAGKN
jgi:hypothetical protein